MECDQCFSCLSNAVKDGRLKDVRDNIYSSQLSDGQRLDILCSAIKNNHTDVTTLLLQNGFESVFNLDNRERKMHPVFSAYQHTSKKTENNVSPLQIALENGNMKIVEMLIERGVEIDPHLASEILLNIVQRSSEKAVKFLLNKGANPNYSNREWHNVTIVNLAVWRQHLKIIELLLINGGDVNARSPYEGNCHPLHFAVEQEDKPLVKLLLKYGANIDAQRRNGSTALHTAIETKSFYIVKYLLQGGATVDFAIPHVPKNFDLHEKEHVEELVRQSSVYTRRMYRTPIEIAVEVGHEKIVELLLDYGANVDTQSFFGKTVLQLAVEKGCLSIIKHVLRHCPDVSNEANKKAFYYTAQSGRSTVYKTIFQKLVQYGFTFSREDINNQEFFKYVVQNDHLEIVEKLIEYGVNINQIFLDAQDGFENTALSFAVECECEDMVELLLNHGADVKCNRIAPVLSTAVGKGNIRITKLLIEKKADVLIDFSILAVAAEKGCVELVEILLKNGANVNSKVKAVSQPYDEKSALYSAVEGGHSEIVDLLLEHGAEIDLGNSHGITPLMIAAKKGYREIVETLLKHGAGIISGPCNGTDLLFDAARNGHDEIIELLLKYGARIESENVTSGDLVIASASRGHVKTVEILLKAGAEVDARNRDGTALNIAAKEGYDKIIKVLLENGANANSKPGYRCKNVTPLLKYSERGQLELVEILLKSGASISSTDEFDRTALHYAAKDGHEEVVNMFLKHGADIGMKDKYGMTALHVSVERGFCKITEILLKNGADIESPDRFGRTAFFIAVEEGLKEIVELLLKHGADINCKAKTIIAPLLVRPERDYIFGKRNLFRLETAYFQYEEKELKQALFRAWGEDCANVEDVHDVLLEYRDKLDTQTGMNVTPLLFSIIKGLLEGVELLLKFGANLELAGSDGKTPLYVAIERDHATKHYFHYHVEIVQMLLRYGAKTDVILEEGRTPLILATENNCESKKLASMYPHNDLFPLKESSFIEIMESLLKLGVSTESKMDNSKTALDIAVEHESLEAVNLLLNYGANVNTKNKDMMTPLLISVEKGNPRIVEALLKFGASAQDETSDGRSAVNVAAEIGNPDIVYLLLNYGANVNTKNKDMMTPLLISVEKGNPRIVEALLKFGASAQDETSDGRSAVNVAAEIGNPDIVYLLLENGADVDSTIKGDMTPLLWSSQKGELKIVETVLNFGANINSKDRHNRDALYFAVKEGHYDIVKALLDHGAKINSTYEQGKTLLHLAAENKCLEIINLLLNFGAVLDATNNLGETPLHVVVKLGQREVVKHLLKFGSRVDCRSNSGATPLLAALNSGRPKIISILLNHGARTHDANLFNKIVLQNVSAREEGTKIVQILLALGSIDEKVVCKSNVRKLLDVFNQRAVLDHQNCDSNLKDCAKVVVRYTTKMETAGMYSSEDKLVAVSYNDESEISAFRNKCEVELARMKSEMVENTNISFYDVLSKNINQLARIANNKYVIKVFKSDAYQKEFPLYSMILFSQFRKGRMRKNLSKKSTKICHSLFQHFSALPYDLVEYIFRFITNEDLRNIIRCWNIQQVTQFSLSKPKAPSFMFLG